ncbi:MAG: DeoR/GlpR family DNA-binding transcription regulator [Candidatus Izemoplasma sp.]|nr:DeoR/GlpR family DNA-binding transcription regulator [Candidatus Izemoplasma sp.]
MKESRLKKMVDYIIRHETATIKELSKVFDVSVYTVRRDINELTKRGIVTKNYGGVAIKESNNKTLLYSNRNTLNKKDKQQISKQAASMIDDGDFIFIDGGTTTAYIPTYIKNINITVVTNNVFVMNQLLDKDNVTVIMLGGEIRKETNSTCGIVTIEQLKSINFDQAFISVTGITNTFQLTNYTAIDAELKKIAMENSKRNYVLVDHSKIGNASLVTFGHLKEIDGIITAGSLSKAYKDYCQAQDVRCFEVFE